MSSSDRRPLSILRLLERPDPERRLGRHRLLRPLGHGVESPHWLARVDDGPRGPEDSVVRLFSCDVMDEPVSGQRPRREAMIREASTLTTIDHRSLARVEEIVVDDGAGVLGLAFEWIDGDSLRALDGMMGLESVLEIASSIASALAGLHSLGLVHRDVRPSTILRRAGQSPRRGRYALVGLGLSAGAISAASGASTTREIVRFAPAEKIGSSLTKVLGEEVGDGPRARRPPPVFGALGYCDPLRMREGGPADASSDLYALGATIFALATGRPPALSLGAKSAELEILFGTAKAPAIRSLNAGIPERLALILDALVDPDPKARPARAVDLVRDLENFASSTPMPKRSAAASPTAVFGSGETATGARTPDPVTPPTALRTGPVVIVPAPGSAAPRNAPGANETWDAGAVGSGVASSMRSAIANADTVPPPNPGARAPAIEAREEPSIGRRVAWIAVGVVAFMIAGGAALKAWERTPPSPKSSAATASSIAVSPAELEERAKVITDLAERGDVVRASSALDRLQQDAGRASAPVLRATALVRSHEGAHAQAIDALGKLASVDPDVRLDGPLRGVVDRALAFDATTDAMLSALGGPLRKHGDALLFALAHDAKSPSLAAKARATLLRDDVHKLVPSNVGGALELEAAKECSVRRAVIESYAADLDALALPELERLGSACKDCGCLAKDGLLAKTIAEVKAKQ